MLRFTTPVKYRLIRGFPKGEKDHASASNPRRGAPVERVIFGKRITACLSPTEEDEFRNPRKLRRSDG
ncbi:hypothetical protein ACFL2X_01045 [Candidatus Latescibacterota bacterium]